MTAMLPRTPIDRLRRLAARTTAACAALWMAACAPLSMTDGTNTGVPIDPNAPVQVALLVPAGSGDSNDALLARNLENAARMAIADLNGVQIDLRVYNSGASPELAAQVATKAADDGAKIILGPLYGGTVNPVGNAVAGAQHQRPCPVEQPDGRGGQRLRPRADVQQHG